MQTLEYTVTFTTPAFLGDAEQNGRWRTPPFKHLLREWWRVVYAAEKGFSVNAADMRREEGLLFGHAWLEDDTFERDGRQVSTAARKSLVRIRLDKWDEGSLKKAQWPADLSVTHPEVRNREGRPVPIGSSLYQGFGPLVYDNQRKTTTLKANAAIQAGEKATLSIAVPENQASRIEKALTLMDRYGTLGGRSRNGWGSFILKPKDGTPPLSGSVPLRDWQACLDLDWPHAIGKDDKGPLIWQTAVEYDDWKALMRDLAIVKIGLRTQFKFTTGNRAPYPEMRHWLSYPVTNHSVQAASWGNSLRLPNTLRFKVRPAPGNPKQFVGVIFHVPCLPPAPNPNRTDIEKVWKCVHAFLDALTKPAGQRSYCYADLVVLGKQKTQLDSVMLKRISE